MRCGTWLPSLSLCPSTENGLRLGSCSPHSCPTIPGPCPICGKLCCKTCGTCCCGTPPALSSFNPQFFLCAHNVSISGRTNGARSSRRHTKKTRTPTAIAGGDEETYFRRLLSVTIHSTSSNLQFVQGAPCSTTLHRTFRARQHWQAFEARRLTARNPVEEELGALRFCPALGDDDVGGCVDCMGEGSGEEVEVIVTSAIMS